MFCVCSLKVVVVPTCQYTTLVIVSMRKRCRNHICLSKMIVVYPSAFPRQLLPTKRIVAQGTVPFSDQFAQLAVVYTVS